MTEEKKKLSGRTWAAISLGVFLLSVALAIVIYIQTDDIGNALWTLLIVFGLYATVASPFRVDSEGDSNFGPSPADATMAGGLLLAGIGLAGLVYSFTDEVLYTVVVIIVVMALIGIFLAIKNRNV